MPEIMLVYSTFASEAEAVSVAQTLLLERLIACANMLPVRSLYRWEGQIQNEPEIVMMAKTTRDKQSAVIARIKSLHSYDVPCIVCYPASDGYAPFLGWVKEETN